jgi:presenilin-like A22 family membrane protease
MRAIAIGWQGAVLGNLLVVALFLYRNSPFMWGIIAILTAMQGLLTVWVLLRDRNRSMNDSRMPSSTGPNT